MPDQVTGRPFGVRFDEAISNLKGKLPEVSLAWDSLAGPVHGKVFTVAGSNTVDLVRDLHAAVVDAKANGSTITAFRKDFDAAVQKHGWTYKGKRGWRTRVIFDANMRSAHMAGRWVQLQANADRRPFLQYRTAGDARVRPMHKQWNGLIYPISDEFWRIFYPPNGWGCRCTVRAYGSDEIEAKGLQVAKHPFEVKTRAVVDRDGNVKDQVPVGIDPGWDHNVGMSWITPELSLGAKLARLPKELQGALVDKTISPAFQRAISANWNALRTSVAATGRPKGEAQILGFLDSATMASLADQVPTLKLESTAIAAFDSKTRHLAGGHKADSNPAQVWPTEAIDELPALLRSYRAVLWDTVDEVLVVVPMGRINGDRPGKIVLRPNIKTKFGKALSMVSLGTVEAGNLLDARYRVLVGSVR